MVSWLRALLPAVPVIIDVAREVRRHREPPPPLPPGADPAEVHASLARMQEAVQGLQADLDRLAARQSALERRLDVIVVALWTLAGVVAMVAIGFLVYLVRA